VANYKRMAIDANLGSLGLSGVVELLDLSVEFSKTRFVSGSRRIFEQDNGVEGSGRHTK